MGVVLFVAVYDADFADYLPVVVGDYKPVLQQVQNACRLVVAVAPCPVSVAENHFYAKRRADRICGALLAQKAEKAVRVPGLESS